MKFDNDITGKKVLVRVDFNVPMKRGIILSDYRIRQVMPTIDYLCSLGAKVIVCSHFGRPKGEYSRDLSLKPIYEYIRCNIDERFHFVPSVIGDEVVRAIDSLDNGQVLMLENLRFYKGEEQNDIAFAEELSKIADYYVDDAFGVSHRNHASNDAIKQFLPSQIGFLMQKERDILNFDAPEYPFVAIMGGAKVKDKIQIIKSLLRKVDKLIIGGALSIPFLQVSGMKCKTMDEGSIKVAKDILDYASKLGKKIVLPVDYICCEDLEGEHKAKNLNVNSITEGLYAVDIGKETIKLFQKELKGSKLIFANGPMGIAEIPKFANGTHKILDAIINVDAKAIVGGGDTSEIVEVMGITDKFYHVSTGGGASLEYIANTKVNKDINKLCMVILDGYGINEISKPKAPKKVMPGSLIVDKQVKNPQIFEVAKPYDAVFTGTSQELKDIFNECPHTLLHASSTMVGLPDGQMGNSEVGHLNIGAGDIVLQELLTINNQIKTGEFFKNQNLNDFIDNCMQDLHIVGLLSDGGVHSHIEHLFALLKLCADKNIRPCIHVITDGRDTDVQAGIEYIKMLQSYIDRISKDIRPIITSVAGRYYAMDREKNRNRTEAYIDCVMGKSTVFEPTSKILDGYNNGETDEFIRPFKCSDISIKNGDSIIFFNIRADRMRQLVQQLSTQKVNILTFTEYSKDFEFAKVAFPPRIEQNTLSDIISSFGLTQLKVAETTKYAHVTYFLNGGVEKAKDKEDRVLIDMVDVPTFDMAPEMSAEKVCDTVVQGLEKNYDFVAVNFANPDMVGHTGDFDATVKAIQAVDASVIRILNKAKELGYIVVLLADHGNAEVMYDDGHICTTHTTSRVPFVVYNAKKSLNLKNDGALCNVAPTILQLMNLI